MTHGIGLEICESPLVSPSSKVTLRFNMVLCIEPIVILPEFGGIVIEDMIVITKNGVKVLNHCPRVFW
ncbi:MAG: M24 family metallopeptidase [Nitrososphaerales archaeon]